MRNIDNKIDLSQSNITNLDDKKYQLEFEDKKDRRIFRKLLFYVMGIIIIFMFAASFIATYLYIFKHPKLNVATKEAVGITVLLSVTLMIPTVLSLAMMRFLFGDSEQKEEKNIPSVIFNIGRELKETLIAFLDRKF